MVMVLELVLDNVAMPYCLSPKCTLSSSQSLRCRRTKGGLCFFFVAIQLDFFISQNNKPTMGNIKSRKRLKGFFNQYELLSAIYLSICVCESDETLNGKTKQRKH